MPTEQALRGGSFFGDENCVFRNKAIPDVRVGTLGFRLVSASSPSALRALRGGCDVGLYLRAASRRGYSPDFRAGYYGFRLVSSAPQEKW